MTDTFNLSISKVKTSRVSQVDFSKVNFGKEYADHMFVADFRDGNWQQFSIEPYAPLTFLPGLAILHYGQSVFEGLKAYKDQNNDVLVFRPEMNFNRLNVSAERMCIPQIPEEIFFNGMNELLRIDKDWVPTLPGTSLYIRPYIFAMDEYIGIRPSDTYKFIIFTCPVGAYYSKPLKVKIETYYSRAVHGGTGYAKAAGNYAGSLYPARLAQKEGYDQLIWTDGATHSNVEEAGTMNLMFVINNTIITAATNDTVLKGVTRESVLTLAREWGMKVEERNIPVKEIVSALRNGIMTEAFGTGTAATIAPIEVIAYDGTDYTIPATNGNSFSSRILNELNDIRSGRKPDTHGWMYKVPV
ncbi:MAG: branched-chain amino acid aminotransferase [Cyclobacteriaceae bacterium]|nr:branched-chain amino acid aminotransferase [Cyclobacteriaceae bacterium]